MKHLDIRYFWLREKVAPNHYLASWSNDIDALWESSDVDCVRGVCYSRATRARSRDAVTQYGSLSSKGNPISFPFELRCVVLGTHRVDSNLISFPFELSPARDTYVVSNSNLPPPLQPTLIFTSSQPSRSFSSVIGLSGSPPPSFLPSPVPLLQVAMASLQERQQMLLDDPDISVVEPHRVFCNRCDKWLKLDATKLYATSAWRSHRNTKSHNMRPPNATTPAPHLLKDGKIIGPTNQRSTEELQFITENPSTASAPAALPTMLSLGGDTMPQGVEPDHQSANVSAQTVAAFNYYRTDAQSNEPPLPHHGQPKMSQESMPPPPPPLAAQKPPLLPVARYNFLGSPVQSAGQPRAPSTPHHITRAHAISISAKDGVIPSAIMLTSRETALS
ncbi:hypothetical protein JB92DRAFT_993391 [Gautieria morchelliformis]|nr:hypothetical protein JB92DRAFT_993391 [Gautieria morchelliformis]